MTKIRYRKRKSARVFPFSAYNFDAEPGDLMVVPYSTILYRLEDRRIGPLAAAGVLYPREIKPPLAGLKSIIEEGEVYWVDY